MKKIFLMGATALLSVSVCHAETLKNDDVVNLHAIGLGEEAIIAKIRNSDNEFKLETDQLIELKAKGLSSSIIAAMLDAQSTLKTSTSLKGSPDSPDPLVPHPSGVYLLADWLDDPKMITINPTTSNQTKTGGLLGYALTAGIASVKFKTSIPNSSASVVSQKARPTFYFYFDHANTSLSNGGNFFQAGIVTSPAEFSLVKFKQKKRKREAKVGKFNIGGAKSGIDDKDQLGFDFEQIARGVYQVVPSSELPAGEYGFIYSSTSGGGGVGLAGVGAQTSKIFDFSIPKVESKK